MGWFPCPECCGRGCPSWTDRFNRADSTDVGPDWEEVSGDWSIAANALHESGSPGALAIARRHPQGDRISFFLQVVAVEPQPGDVYRFVVNYLDDEHYHYFQFSYIEDPVEAFLLQLYRREGEGDFLLAERQKAAHSGAALLQVCFTGNMFLAVEEYGVWSCVTPFAGGYRAGLGNGGSQPIEFDDFYFSESGATNPACPRCGCFCEARCLPKKLHLEIAVQPVEGSGPSDYDCLDGIEFDLDVDQDLPGIGFDWQHVEVLPTCPLCEPWDDTGFVLRCSDVIGQPTEGRWRLVVKSRLTQALGLEVELPPEPESTCDPLYLVFILDMGLCTQESVQSRITFTITEAVQE